MKEVLERNVSKVRVKGVFGMELRKGTRNKLAGWACGIVERLQGEQGFGMRTIIDWLDLQ